MDQATLEYVVHHLFLPPKLPQSAEPDSTTAVAEIWLLDFVLSSLQTYQRRCTSESRQSWVATQAMLVLWNTTKPWTETSAKLLAETMSNMNPGGKLLEQAKRSVSSHNNQTPFQSEFVPRTQA